jgi:peptide/nickel transport system substrate-binding protein
VNGKRLPVFLVTLSVALLALVFAGACGGDDSDGGGDPDEFLTKGTEGGEPVSGGVLRVYRSLEPESLNPIGPIDNGSSFTIIQLFDRLVEYMPGEEDPQPGLAEEWEVSDDGLTYDFTLREGVRFSNGDPLTPDDVLFSLRRWADPKLNVAYAQQAENVKSISLAGPRTLRIELTEPTPALLAYLTMFPTSIVPEDVIKEVGEDEFGKAPVGSGPFMLEEYVRGSRLELVANPHYWREGQPYLEGVTFNIVLEDNARILALRSGEADVIERIPFRQIEEVDSNPELTALLQPLSSMLNIYVNHNKAPTNSVEVRRALVHATPRDAILKTALAGKAELSTGVIPKGPYWDADIDVLPENLERARKLLADAGFADGFSIELSVPQEDDVLRQIAEIIQPAWGEIGVDVRIRLVDEATLFDRQDNLEAWFYGTDSIIFDVPIEDYSTPQVLDFSTGFNGYGTGYKSREATKIVAEATTSVDEGRRQELFSRLQQLSLDDVHSIPLAYLPARTGVRDNVRNFNTLPGGWWRLEQVYLDPQ